MRHILILVVVLFAGILAQADWTPAQQEQLAKSWGAGQYGTQQATTYAEQNQKREVRCFTRQVPGTGLFGNAPQYETVCK